MGKLYQRIDQELRDWMARQQMFFVATAPRGDQGHVNVSPKGHDTLRILDGSTLAYLDYGGSGIETVAHLRENGRIVIMMCAFEGPPRIFRFHGNGSVVTPQDDGFATLAAHFDRSQLGTRASAELHRTTSANQASKNSVPTSSVKIRTVLTRFPACRKQRRRPLSRPLPRQTATIE
jgi:hypothetical protein